MEPIKNKRWTKADRNHVLATISEKGTSPQTFIEVAAKLNRTVDAVRWQYYTKTKKKRSYKKRKKEYQAPIENTNFSLKNLGITSVNSKADIALAENNLLVIRAGQEVIIISHSKMHIKPLY